MTIILFLNKDLEANILYNLLKEELLKHTVYIYYSDTVGNPDKKPEDLNQLEHYEKSFVYNQVKAYSEAQSTKVDFEFFGDDFKTFPFKKCTAVNTEAFINEISALQPDVFISVRFGKIFKDNIIQVPKYGLLNLHSAILPDYRGILGTLHALKAGEETIGCTLHTIPNSGIDTGELIAIAKLKVDTTKSLFWHVVQLYPLGFQLIKDALQTLEKGERLKTIPQNLEDGNYFSVPTQNDFDSLKQSGFKVISKQDYLEVLGRFVFKDIDELLEVDLT